MIPDGKKLSVTYQRHIKRNDTLIYLHMGDDLKAGKNSLCTEQLLIWLLLLTQVTWPEGKGGERSALRERGKGQGRAATSKESGKDAVE